MEEAQYCQPCGYSPGSRASCSGVRWQACKATKLARHQNPCLSRSAEAACNSHKHPCKNVGPSSAPPGLPPLVFVDQSSGGRPPWLSSHPMRLGGYNRTVICSFSGDVDRSNVVQPHTLAKVLRSSPLPAIPSGCLCAPSHGS